MGRYEKAARILSARRWRRVKGPFAVFEVDGDSDSYEVLCCPRYVRCPCEARMTLCAHAIVGATLFIEAYPEHADSLRVWRSEVERAER